MMRVDEALANYHIIIILIFVDRINLNGTICVPYFAVLNEKLVPSKSVWNIKV